MLRPPRWEAEQRLIENHFPNFAPFATDHEIGFSGWLPGGRGRRYAVLVKARIRDYPQREPKVFMRPHIGSHWFADGSLCWHMDGQQWNPSRDTFFKVLIVVLNYLKCFE